MTATSTLMPVQLPQGNTGREYNVVDVADIDHVFSVRVEPMTSRRVLPSVAARLEPHAARALGVRLVELAAFDEAALGNEHAGPGPQVRAYGGRTYSVRLRASSGGRRVQLVARSRDGVALSSITDAFSAAHARALGVALIVAAGPR